LLWRRGARGGIPVAHDIQTVLLEKLCLDTLWKFKHRSQEIKHRVGLTGLIRLDDAMQAIWDNLPIPFLFVMVVGMKKTLLVLNDLKIKGHDHRLRHWRRYGHR
jgi:hypothetical protein